MIRGYVSSDEEEDEFGYSEPLVVNKPASPPPLPEVQTEKMREKIFGELQAEKKRKTFLTALLNGNFAQLEEILSSGYPIDQADDHGWSPLMRVSGAGNSTAVAFLLEHGSNPNYDAEMFTPLMACCTETLVEEASKLACVRLLLQHGAEVNARDKYGMTALMYACSSGYFDIVWEFLRAPGLNINIQDREGWSALFHAVNQNNIRIVKQLLSSAVNLKLKDKFNRTPLNLALDKNLKEMAVVLGYQDEIVSEPLQTEKSLRERFLNELPLPDGQGGFPSESKRILKLFNQHNTKSVDFPDFLNMTEADLQQLGVKVKYNRQKILTQGIHRYHLHPWTKSSMPSLVQGVPMSTEQAVALMGSIAKHLTIANASLRYIGIRISLEKMKPSDVTVNRELVTCFIHTLEMADSLQTLLSKISRHVDNMEPEMQADCICKMERKKKVVGSYLWYTLGTLATGFLFHFYAPSLINLIELVEKCMSSAEIIQGEPTLEYPEWLLTVLQ